ncbi:hypothetical protein A2422_00285 [Candidatus Woesebacteria bacterium RIFOXYC1_FULL_31_51]|uniref:Uncharacterized protein n=1 Tax=Candidatus Woesebacteria bacterium GW2011_GWC2_31_9 TaxID=1618586 RepID=A0A0F9YK39_9BACT|nr:MAG: hypothetical protein UR17_C0001G0424 [Candidatus Woesebacteria bacterium GW2011_GWF1_31_35]KKP23087.1 MAG: hypothetical protein UR11_C0001G0061 [Candidatus Woesebacteria bacterium GW2011_GWC1_30_29]KKP26775.1 MAG: hypothetical protein UR13_C0002G0010 [Candidatus Woesebacteria bacterium GW2011_GWD1_31_12]KKP27350.1 MAG: hypothetical protein UR16_C0003G0010 [Candidatus Woesebacteria bacterium GW2011_GWB1_31_29]KKP30746.1 MAG: hypothetical protein UR20_C0053G0002 [Candidatus Woesebacteria 
MPKKGIAKCQTCDWEIEGNFPDHEPVGWNYMWTSDGRENDFDKEIGEKLLEHHLDTRSTPSFFGKLYGHKNYEVFLENGSTGEMEANSYFISYNENGKER